MKKINIKITLIMLLMMCFAGGVSAQQPIDSRLWGEWILESIRQTTIENNQEKETQTLLIQNVLKQRSSFPNDVLLSMYMFENIIGVCYSNSFSKMIDINEKGTFSTNNGRLKIILNSREGIPVFDFAYKIVDRKIILDIVQPDSTNPNIKYSRQLVYVVL